MPREDDRLRASRHEDLLLPLRERDHRDARQVERLHRGERRRELALAAVDHDEVRRRRERLVVLVGGHARGEPREAPRDHLPHRREVVHPRLPADPELAVVRLLRQPVLEDDHRADVVLAHRGRDVEALDAQRQRLEVERLAQLLERLDAAQPALLALREVAREHVERVLVGEPLQAPLLAPLGRPDLDPRPAPLRQELRERRQVSRVARHDDLRRHARRAAVVLEPERLENRRHVLAADVLEMERVPIDHLAAAQREDLDDGAVALGGESDDVHRPDRLRARPPAARRGAEPRTAGCDSAPRPRSARPLPLRASAARARAGSASRRRRGTRSRRR